MCWGGEELEVMSFSSCHLCFVSSRLYLYMYACYFLIWTGIAHGNEFELSVVNVRIGLYLVLFTRISLL